MYTKPPHGSPNRARTCRPNRWIDCCDVRSPVGKLKDRDIAAFRNGNTNRVIRAGAKVVVVENAAELARFEADNRIGVGVEVGAVRVAVNVTGCVNSAVGNDETTLTVVRPAETVCVRGGDVDAAKLPLAAYCAVIV